MKLKPWIVRWYWMMLLIIPTLSQAGASSYKATNPDEKVNALSYNDLIADIESYTSFNPAQKNKVVQAFYLHTKGNDYQQFLSQSGIQLKGAGVVNGAGNWMDDIFNLQKSVVNQNKNIISNASNNAKGAWGEMASDAFLTEKGFQPLHPRKSALTDGWGETGIDGIFKKNGQYYIVEAKYTGSATLNVSNDGKQLSKTWIEGSNRLENAVGSTVASEIKLLGYKKIWAKTAPDGTIVFKEATDDFATTFIDFIP